MRLKLIFSLFILLLPYPFGIAQGAFLVANGLPMKCQVLSSNTYMTGKENYFTFISSADENQWREIKVTILPQKTGFMRVELFTIPSSDKSLAVLFDDFSVNGKIVDNGGFEDAFNFWDFFKKIKPNESSPTLVYGKLAKSGDTCARVFDRKNQLSKNIAVQKNVPIELAVWFKKNGTKADSRDFPINLKPYLTTDFVAATSIVGDDQI